MAEPRFRAPRGTRDILPPESDRRRALVDRFAEVVGRAGYSEIATPLFEDIGVFLRIGESTDVVTKEMYDFHDKSDPPHHLALRPEGTASVVRAFVEHKPIVPWKVWYATPSFRYEKPQKGRFRQHHQVGVEALGPADPDLDVVVIDLLLGRDDGLELLEQVKRTRPELEVVIITGNASIESAVGCIRRGAFDYLAKPFDDLHRVRTTIRKAIERRRLVERNQALERAGRVADFLEFGELMCRDALTREESCGGHFREEHEVDGEAKRDDENFCHVSAWGFQGVGKEPTLHTEPLEFENVKLTQRSYK